MTNSTNKIQEELDYLREEVDKQNQLIETMNEELVLQKYYMMLIVQSALGKRWEDFTNSAQKIPNEIYQHAHRETWDLSEARKLIEDIFQEKPKNQ